MFFTLALLEVSWKDALNLYSPAFVATILDDGTPILTPLAMVVESQVMALAVLIAEGT
ncbi:hypothetical protein D3C81_1801290 [compost metagenome]